MDRFVRQAFPYFILALGLAALVYAVSFGTLPPADFVFNNGEEVATVDPAKATGEPEGRILSALFEGLLSEEPGKEAAGDDGLVPYVANPGVAERYEISPDGRTYTFHLRQNALWTDGTSVTAHDFIWSWRRTLHPETASQYAFQLHYIVGGKDYNEGNAAPGTRVEVELSPRPKEGQLFPRGPMVYGILRDISKPPEPSIPERATDDEKADLLATWKQEWTYQVEVKPGEEGQVAWDAAGKLRSFCAVPTPDAEFCQLVLPSFYDTVGVSAPSERTLVVKLNNPTAFFPHLAAFYPYYPVNRHCIEEYGSPNWTKPANIVTNGPYRLEFRRVRDRVRLAKNEEYWNAARVQLKTIDALAIKSDVTALYMYEDHRLDWAKPVPNFAIPKLKERSDYYSAPMLSVYYYRLNVTRPPLDNASVRRALNMAIDKQQICEYVAKAGQVPARNICPPGMAGYTSPQGDAFDIAAARKLLAEAGFPDGKGFPAMKILYNTSEGHRDIAEVIQSQWREHLGIRAQLENKEWKTYLDDVQHMQYTVARAGWVGDYPDPNTFLDLWVADGPQNNTGWKNANFDKLIAAAAAEPDVAKRFVHLQEAEKILNAEMPILPIYFYVSINLVRPYVKGFTKNLQDHHPLHLLEVDAEARAEAQRTREATP